MVFMIGKNTKILFLLIVVFCFLKIAAEPVWSADNVLRVRISSTPSTVYSIRTVYVQEEPFVPLDELARTISWNANVQPVVNNISVAIGRNIIRAAGDNPFLLIDNQIYQMPLESRFHAGHVYVPVRYFFPILQEHLQGLIRYSPREQLIEVAPETIDRSISPGPGETLQPPPEEIVQPLPIDDSYNLSRIAIEEKANGTLVRIQAGRMFRQEDFSSWVHDAGYLYVQIYGGRLDPVALTASRGKGSVSQVIPEQQPQLAQISLKLKEPIQSHEVGQDPRTKEIFVTLYKKLTATETTDDVVAALLREQQKKWEIDVITLDAGHGGKDPGTRGSYYRTKEKDIVLDIVLRLGKLIESRTNIRVVYTRKKDVYLPVYRRTQIANQAKSKLFISVHANWNRRRSARGFDVYILGQGKDQAAIEIAEKENSVVKEFEGSEKEYEDFFNGNKMLYSILQSGFVKESEALAANVSQGMGAVLNAKNRGVKQARFLVLWRASMPNILIETGFVSNKSEEKNLRSRAYRQKIAEGIFRGIQSFIKYHQENMARAIR